MPEPLPFGHVTIIGVGLVGASIALALRKVGFTGTITAADKDAAALRDAEAMGLADHYASSAAMAAKGADIVIICTPVRAMADIGRAIAPTLKPGAIVTDVGSVKGAVIDMLAPVLPPHAHLVPGHPIAGSEQSGPQAGYASLFNHRWTILTPPEGTDEAAVEAVTQMWHAFGAEIEIMDPKRHDMVLAITSHLPHLIAYNIVRTADDMETVAESEVIKFSAGGFRDFTRIAASDPTMWRDVFLSNKDAVLECLGRFSEDLAILQRAIRWGEGETLFEIFTRTRAIRMGIVQAGQDTAAPDFGRPRDPDSAQ